ncbi:unnamed protein product [marine sediment metagenome]|uniref:Uncharacterized protein n=1 Tax=marine sediment metagenome TaxID=412755 RepID=X1STV6_9ZZZZ
MGIKWKKVVQVAVEEAKAFRGVVGVSPTLRALFYRLVSKL